MRYSLEQMLAANNILTMHESYVRMMIMLWQQFATCIALIRLFMYKLHLFVSVALLLHTYVFALPPHPLVHVSAHPLPPLQSGVYCTLCWSSLLWCSSSPSWSGAPAAATSEGECNWGTIWQGPTGGDTPEHLYVHAYGNHLHTCYIHIMYIGVAHDVRGHQKIHWMTFFQTHKNIIIHCGNTEVAFSIHTYVQKATLPCSFHLWLLLQHALVTILMLCGEVQSLH